MPPLLLLPGLMCDARLFAPQVAAFSARRSVLVPWLGAADSMEALAALVLEQAPPVFALAGLSMGGIVAMEVVRQAPDRVARLALMDTNPLAEAPAVQVRRQPQIDRALAGDLAGVLNEAMIPQYLAKPDPALEALCLTMALDMGPQVFARQSRALRDRPDQCETLRRYTGPALVLTGAHDRLCPIERHTLMHTLMPQSRLVVINGAGHMPTLERPDETNAALRGWIEE